MSFVTQDKTVLYYQPNGIVDGKGTAIIPLSIDRHGFTGKTNATIPGKGQVYGRDGWGRIGVKATFKEPPGGLLTGTIEWDEKHTIEFLETKAETQDEFALWSFYVPCARLDNPQGWLNGGKLVFRGKVSVTNESEGDGPVRDASGEIVVNSVDISWDYNIRLRPLALTNVSPTNVENTEDITGITMLEDPNPGNCVPGYRGPGKHLFITLADDATAAAENFFSRDGGSTWTKFTNFPYAVVETGKFPAVKLTTSGRARLITACTTSDAAAFAKIAYADITFGAEAAATWTNVSVGGANAEVVEAMEWLYYTGLYVATAGDISKSEDQGATFTSLYTGAVVINTFIKGYGESCHDVYALGATNLILKANDGSDTFAALVGPSGGAAFGGAAMASNGLLFAGNATTLYSSYNDGLNAGGWTALKDFGGTNVIKNVFIPKGDSQNIYVNVSEAADGEFWHSNDGGLTWNQLTSVSNGGYLDAVANSEDLNEYFICGTANALFGLVHKASPSSSGC